MDDIFGIVVFFGGTFGFFIWAVFFRGKPRKLKYDDELSSRIERMNYLNEQIKQIDKLKTDAGLADHDHHYRFSFERQTITGEEISADIWVDGSSPLSAQTSALLDERKKELLRALFSEMFKLPYRKRRNTNVIQTTELFTKGEEVDV